MEISKKCKVREAFITPSFALEKFHFFKEILGYSASAHAEKQMEEIAFLSTVEGETG